MRWLSFYRLLFWLATNILGITPLHAQYAIRHITTKDGLSQGSVYHYLEDSRGYMWMTSQNGLNRLEGSRFRTYAHEDINPGSIGKGELRGLVEAPNGDLWVGTEVCLSRYIRRTDTFQNFYLVTKQGKRLFSQNRPFFVDDSTVWFLNNQRGVVSLNYHTHQLRPLLPDVAYEFMSITREVVMDRQHGQLWLRLAKGLLRYDLNTKKRHYYLTQRPDDRIGKERVLYALCNGPDGSVWVSTDKGIARLTADTYQEYTIGIDTENDPVFSLSQTPDGRLWIATSRSGILVMDVLTGRISKQIRRDPFQVNSLADNHVSELHVGRNGWVWASVDPVGVDLIYPATLKPYFVEDNPLDSTDFNSHGVRGIAQDTAGFLWVGTIAQGVRRMNVQSGTMNRYAVNEGLKNFAVRSLFCSSSGQVIVGTNGGLAIWQAQQQRFTILKIPSKTDPVKANVIRNIYPFSTDLLLLATSAGLYTLSERHVIRHLYDSTSAYSGALFYDRQNGLLFAGRRDRDLQCFSVRGTSIYHQYNMLPGHSPTCFHKRDEYLWIGTDNGLIKYHVRQKRIVKRFTTADGLPDNSVFSLLTDADGSFWIGTNHGLAIFDRQERISVIPETANTEFTSNAAYQTDSDHLFLGTTTGLLRIRPSHIKNTPPAPVHFVKLTVNDLPVNHPVMTIDESDTLLFPYDQNNLEVQVAALDYLSTTPSQYQYRLVGQRAQWVHNGDNPQIRYTNLSPGWYQLQARALASTGLWTTAKAVTIYIDQPFWERWWFRALLILLVVCTGYWLTKFYVHQKQQAQRRLTSRLLAAQESERQRIAQDLHDDVGNTLAAAKGTLNRLIDSVANQKQSDFLHVGSLLEKAGNDLRTISHNLMPVEFDTYPLDYVLNQSVAQTREASGIDIDFISAGLQQHISSERALLVYRIVNELLTNIQKHSAAQTATVQLLYQADNIMVTVEDDGRGIDASKTPEKETGIGLKNISSRASYLGARLDVSSNQSGTCVILAVPYG